MKLVDIERLKDELYDAIMPSDEIGNAYRDWKAWQIVKEVLAESQEVEAVPIAYLIEYGFQNVIDDWNEYKGEFLMNYESGAYDDWLTQELYYKSTERKGDIS